MPSGLRTVALVIFGALFMLASRCGSATMTFEVVNHMTQQYSWWEDDQFECGVYWPIGWIAVSGHPDDSLGEQLGYSHTCFSYSVEVAALMGYFVAWILVYSTGLCRWKWSVKRLPVAGMSDKRRRLVATECQERKNMVPSSVSAMDARRQPAPALALSALRRRVNVDVGIGMLFAVIAMLVPHLVGMQFRMLNRIIPVALVAANTAFVLGAYHHVRLRGYHGLWALVAFLGPVLDGFLLALCLFPHLGFGESADWAARGLIQFSGLAALVFLPQRQMPSSPVPDSDAP